MITHRRLLMPLRPRAVAVASNWWLAGGIDPANCIFAYQPKGAADYAASKVNLANPGTYNAVDGDAYPSFNTATGWTGDASTQYLSVSYKMRSTGSYGILITGVPSTTNQMFFGSRITKTYGVGRYYGGHLLVKGGDFGTWYFEVSTSKKVLIASKYTAYSDGTSLGSFTSYGDASSVFAIFARATNDDNTTRAHYCNGSIGALVYYDSELSVAQVSALTTAMAAL